MAHIKVLKAVGKNGFLCGMIHKTFSLGIEFGTNPVRALILNLENGEVMVSGLQKYPGGDQGVLTPKSIRTWPTRLPGRQMQ